MDTGAILRELTHAEGLPKEALKAATAQRVEMLPLFLNEIEAYLALGLLHGQSRHRSFSSSICSASGGKRPLIGPWHVY